MRGLPLLPLLAAVLLIAACQTTDRPSRSADDVSAVDPATAQLVAAHGLVPAGPTSSTPITVGDVADVPWALYLEASNAVGLDFRALEGRAAQLRATPIRGRHADAAVYVLVVDGRAVGAWIGPGGATSGVLALDEEP